MAGGYGHVVEHGVDAAVLGRGSGLREAFFIDYFEGKVLPHLFLLHLPLRFRFSFTIRPVLRRLFDFEHAVEELGALF